MYEFICFLQCKIKAASALEPRARDLGRMANLRTRRQARSGACQAEATSISVVKTSSE